MKAITSDQRKHLALMQFVEQCEKRGLATREYQGDDYTTRSNPRGRMRKAMYPDLKAEYTIMVDRDKTYRRKRYRDAMNLAKKEARTANEVVVTQDGNVVKVMQHPKAMA